MKILFIYKYTPFFEPMMIMGLSSSLKIHGHECFYIDPTFERNLLSEVKKISPEIIAYSVTTGMHKYYLNINNALKNELKFVSIFGGSHCTYFPDFINNEGVDVICRGEGEYALIEFINKYSSKSNLTDIKNIWIKQDGQVFKNTLRDLVSHLDELPFIDRDILNRYKIYNTYHIRDIMVGRGCPYKCSYCFNHSYNKIYEGKGNILRLRSKENVIKELIELKKSHNPKIIKFFDDTFILNKTWVIDFLDIYKREIKLPFRANVRVNLIDEEIVEKLKEAGAYILEYGIESGNESIRNSILKRNITDQQTYNAAKILKKFRIKTLTFNIFGLPDETIEKALDTVKLNIDCKPAYAWSCMFQPYPMTELNDYCVEKNYFDGSINQFNDSYLAKKSVLKTKDIKKLERLHLLFSITVSFPRLIKILKPLTALPLNALYKLFYYAHKISIYLFFNKEINFSQLYTYLLGKYNFKR